MKKKVLTIVVIIILFLLTSIVLVHIKYSKVKSFNLNDYQHYIQEFSSDEVLGPVKNAKDAKKKAEGVWIEIYGKDVKKERPYQVSYDSENKVWMVEGTLTPNHEGGVAYFLIEEDTGKVLAVWHGK